jgi:hypothetical protein
MALVGVLLIAAALVTFLVVGLGALTERFAPAVVGVVATAAVLAAGVGFAFIVFRIGLANDYDPNAGDAEARKQLGQSQAILKRDLPEP